MMLFAFEALKATTKILKKAIILSRGLHLALFENGWLQVDIQMRVWDEEWLIRRSIAHSYEQLFSVLLLAQTLKKAPVA